MTITPDYYTTLDGVQYAVIDDVQNCTSCLFRTEGDGSIDDVVAKHGDDIDAILQSAVRYITAD